MEQTEKKNQQQKHNAVFWVQKVYPIIIMHIQMYF